MPRPPKDEPDRHELSSPEPREGGAGQVENYWELLDDLDIYREELQLRNDQLAEAQSALDALEDLLLEAPLGHLALDAAGTILECNPTAGRLLGLDPESAVGWSFGSFVHPEHRRRLLEHLLKCKVAGAFVRTELTLRSRRGVPVPCQLVSRAESPVEDRYVFRTAILDLSDRKRVEEALQRAERRFSAAVEASGAGVFEIEIPFQGLLYLSHRVPDILGYTRTELAEPARIPAWIEERVHTDDRERIQGVYEDLSSGRRGAYQGDVRFRHKDGSWRWIRIWTKAAPAGEEATRYLVGVAMDVTSEKVRAMEIERRAHQLRTLAAELYQVEERERRELASELHDNLAQLIVAAKMKLGMIGSMGGAPLRQPLEEALQLLDRADESVRSMTFSLSPPVLDELGLASAVKWLANDMTKQFGLSVEVEARGELVVADPRLRFMLFRSIRELLINSAKHSGARRARVLLESNGDEFRVVVEDRGGGFDPERARAEGSQGFGLFSIQERLESIGGRLSVESAPGRGTRVTLSLEKSNGSLALTPPPTDPAAAGPAPAGAGTSRRETIRVLLADDHELVRSALARLLESQSDVQVIGEASDGESAVELATRLTPDVVVMDVTMSGLGGIEATRRIAAEHPEVRVVGLSMHESDDIASAMKNAGAFEYLRKSSPSHVLLRTIRKAANRVPSAASPPSYSS